MSQTKSTPAELGKSWAGKVVDDKFPLRQWLGGTEQSAVFLTERAGTRKAVIKLILADNRDGDAQLSLWKSIAKLSHPHLIQMFECGRCQIEGTRLLYVVMESADENLAEILPVRPLTPVEASEMLPPAAEALGFLHRAGFVHGRVKPSNITAVDNQLKLSTDTLRKAGEANGPRAASAYDAPEVAAQGLSPAADVWSLGMTLVAVLTRNEPKSKAGNGSPVTVSNSIPQPLREIARQCLQTDPQLRCTVHDIVRRLRAPTASGAEKAVAKALQQRPKRWVLALVVLAALLVGVWLSIEVLVHRTPIPAAETQSAGPGPTNPATQSPPPFSANSGHPGVMPGSVRQQVQPDVSRNALNTITGRLKVAIQASVDASGNVSQAKFVSPGPSQYFANRAMAAAQRWKFNPPQLNGHAAESEWLLRFQFTPTSVQVFPAEVKP
jgi:serine/threonine-protein kinase